MVLGTSTPADNEPGGLGTPHEEFNKNVQAGTIRAALLPWLQASELKDGVWKDVVHAYFKANAAHILETVRGWSKGNKRITEFHPHRYPYVPMPPPEDFLPPPFPPPPASSTTSAPSNGVTQAPTLTAPPIAPTWTPSDAENLQNHPLPPGWELDPSAYISVRSSHKVGKAKTTNLYHELEEALKEFL